MRHTPWFQGVASTRFSLNLRRTGQWSRLVIYQLLESYSSGARSTMFEPSSAGPNIEEDALFLIELARAGGKIYSSDRFNFSMNRKADVSRHTWNSNIDDFFIDGTILAPGFAESLISV